MSFCCCYGLHHKTKNVTLPSEVFTNLKNPEDVQKNRLFSQNLSLFSLYFTAHFQKVNKTTQQKHLSVLDSELSLCQVQVHASCWVCVFVCACISLLKPISNYIQFRDTNLPEKQGVFDISCFISLEALWTTHNVHCIYILKFLDTIPYNHNTGFVRKYWH